MEKMIEDVSLEPTWTSYMAAMGGLLKSCGYYSGSIKKLMGQTGMAFHFIMHKKVCASSVTVYSWIDEHREMLDRIGVETQGYCDMDYNSQQRDVVDQDINRIRQSIDGGIPVITWAPSDILEFGLITGYDDKDEVFFVSDVTGRDLDPLLYTNLGLSNVPILYYRVIKAKKKLDENAINRSALRFAVEQWEKEEHVSPDYSSGRKGYDNVIQALEYNDFDLNGLSYNFAVYADSKGCIMEFLQGMEGADELTPVIERYSQVSKLFNKIKDKVPFPFDGELNREDILNFVDKLQTCRQLEEEAIQGIKAFLK